MSVMRSRVLALALAAGAGFPATATPAMAQLAGSASGQSSIVAATPSEGLWAIQMMGRCFATDRTDKAMMLMAAAPGTPAEDAAVKALIGRPTACMRSLKSAQIDRATLRMVIADGFVRDVGVAVAPTDFAPVAKLDAAQRRAMGVYGLIRALGDCVSARHPDAVSALAATRLGSAEESVEMARLMPLAEACSPGGMKFTLDQDIVRGAMSEGLVRRMFPVLAGAGAGS